MPVQPNFLERLLFFQLEQAPAPLLDLAGALSYQALATAAQLNLFQVLAEGSPMGPVELAGRLESEERGIRALLLALEATGYVEEKDGLYANSSTTEKWLVGESFFDMASAARYWSAMITEMLPQAAEVIRSGQRPHRFYDWVESEPDLAAAFQRMMVTNAALTGDTIAGKIDMAPAGRLLDVGGGHGMFTVALCQRYPKLQATILDSPAALDTAREMVARHGLADRIELVEGDMWQLPWGDGYDCVLLFNLLHHFDLGTNKQLLGLAAGALNPGGKVAILEQLEGRVNGAASNAFVRLIALQYYLLADGRVYTAGEISQMLVEGGFSAPRFHSLAKAPGSTLAVATKE